MLILIQLDSSDRATFAIFDANDLTKIYKFLYIELDDFLFLKIIDPLFLSISFPYILLFP
jgi:hypothetical protein